LVAVTERVESSAAVRVNAMAPVLPLRAANNHPLDRRSRIDARAERSSA